MLKKLNKIIDEFKDKNYKHFNFFYDETKNIVYYAIIMIIKDEEIAKDIMQDVYIKFINSLDKYESNTNIYSYLTVMAKNFAINEYNKRKREIVDEEYVLDTPDKYNEDLGLIKLLDILPQEEKEIILLHIVNNKKFKDIAEVINKPLGTVLWLYNKGLKTLRERLGDK